MTMNGRFLGRLALNGFACLSLGYILLPLFFVVLLSFLRRRFRPSRRRAIP